MPPTMSYPSASGHHPVSCSPGSEPSSSFRGYQYPSFSSTVHFRSHNSMHPALPPPNIPSSSHDHATSRYSPSSTQDAWSQHSRPSASVSRRSPVDSHCSAPRTSMLYAQILPRPRPSPPLASPIPPLTNSRPMLPGLSSYPSSSNVPRLPPILQVEKQQVTTSATQAASASRRKNQAYFSCPVSGCGSTFTRQFNLKSHLRSHTAERPFLCDWPECNKRFARQHDCKRHQALHTALVQSNVCMGCGKTFSRLDALKVNKSSHACLHPQIDDIVPQHHLRSDGGAECRTAAAGNTPGTPDDEWDNRSNSTESAPREISP